MIKDYVAFDLETTGTSPERSEIIEIGAVKVEGGKVTDRFARFINPHRPIPPEIEGLTGISNEMVRQAADAAFVVPEFLHFCDGFMLVGHNLMFDYTFTRISAARLGLPFDHEGIDTLKIARQMLKDLPSRSLGALCDHYGIVNARAHRAYHDALATAKLYQTLGHYFEADDPEVFVPKPLIYKPKKQRPMTKKQKAYLNDLCKYHKIEFNEPSGGMTMSQASRMIDRIILTHGQMK